MNSKRGEGLSLKGVKKVGALFWGGAFRSFRKESLKLQE